MFKYSIWVFKRWFLMLQNFVSALYFLGWFFKTKRLIIPKLALDFLEYKKDYFVKNTTLKEIADQ